MSQLTSVFILEGIILAKVERVESDSDYGESEDEQQQFSDFADFSMGGPMMELSTPSFLQVVIQEMLTNKPYNVFGRFLLLDPWWKVSVKVKCGGRNKYFANGYPSYSLLTHLDKKRKNIISLFLTACGLDQNFRTNFINWLPEEYPLDFTTLEEMLQTFANECDMTSYNIEDYLHRSLAGRSVKMGMKFPSVMEYVPRLLPAHFKRLLGGGYDENDIRKLEDIVNSDVWILGFSTMVRKHLRFMRCEATLDAFKQCDLFLKIPDLQRNGLILYNELKKMCRELGDTYVEEHILTKSCSKKVSVECAWEALKFLKDEGIMVIEKKRVFLPALYDDEKTIADCIRTLSEKPAWHINVNVKDALINAQVMKQIGMTKDEHETACTMDRNHEDSEINQPNEKGGCSAAIVSLSTDDSLKECMGNDFFNDNGDDVNPSVSVALDPDQVKAGEMICANAVTVISGKGGCGKTHVVSVVFKAAFQNQYIIRKGIEKEVEEACEDFENDEDASETWDTFFESSAVNSQDETIKDSEFLHISEEIILTAPTGRAASLLRKRTGFSAYTLHQIAWSFWFAKQQSKDNMENEPWKFSDARVLVVDEGSLVSVRILASVLKMLVNHGKLSKLIILGDVRQLPSIEPGNTLADIFATVKNVGWAIELKTNHRAESQLIVDNATRLCEFKALYYDAELYVQSGMDITMPTPDKRFILVKLHPCNDDSNLRYAVEMLLKKGPGLETDRRSQFIAFRMIDCDLINELCCKHYSGHSTRLKRKLNFQPKDKVCCTKNGYVADLKDILEYGQEITKPCKSNKLTSEGEIQNHTEQEPGSTNTEKSLPDNQKTIRLCNGEIYFIDKDVEVDEVRCLTLTDLDNCHYTVDFKQVRKTCKLRHAWARTIHTFQGSEAETVVYVVGNAGRQNMQHVYTAITRGCNRVYVVAETQQLDKTVMMKSRVRKTRLRELLQKSLPKKPAFGQDISGQMEDQPITDFQHSLHFDKSITFELNNPESRTVKSSTPLSRTYAANPEFSQVNSYMRKNSDATEGLPKSQHFPTEARESAAQSMNEQDKVSLVQEIASQPLKNKRLYEFDDDTGSPSKTSKVSSEESPLCSTRLKNLSLDGISRRQLFDS